MLAGLFGAALIGLLWAPWYRYFAIEGRTFFGNSGLRSLWGAWHNANAWQAMTVNDVILLVAGALGVWLAVATMVSSTGAVPVTAAVFASLGGLLASALALIRVIWPPDLGLGPTFLGAGSALGVLAAFGLALSAGASMRDERRTAPGTASVPVTELPAPGSSGA